MKHSKQRKSQGKNRDALVALSSDFKAKHHKKVISKAISNINKETVLKETTAKRRKKSSSKISADVKRSIPFEDSTCSSDEMSQSEYPDRSIQRANRSLKAERSRRTLFVGNLPVNVTRKDLRKLFTRVLRSDLESVESGCRVESVRLRGFVPTSGGTGKLARKRAAVQAETPGGMSQSLIGYVVLSSSVGVRPSLALNGHWFDPGVKKDTSLGSDHEGNSGSSSGRHIRVDCAAHAKPSRDLNSCVFLGNLPFDTVEDEVRQALSTFGEVSYVRLIRDRATGAVKGFGYVQFADPVSVSLAIRSSETVHVRNRAVRIEECRDTSQGQKKIKPSNPETKKTRPKKSIVSKLNHVGQIKGITLPSNVRGAQRELILQKRLLKKRKRQLRRKQATKSESKVLKKKETQI